MTPAELADRLHRDLGPLALDAEWDVIATSGQAYGTYTDAILDALGAVGIAEAGLASATTPGDAATSVAIKAAAKVERQVRSLALTGCLDRLEAYYATQVDTVEGPLSLKLSQVFTQIQRMRSRLTDGVATGTNVRGYRRKDFALGSGNVDYEAGV